MQYLEMGIDFLSRLLAEEGLGYTFVEDLEAPVGHRLTLFADSTKLPELAFAGMMGMPCRAR